jgi:eukaryotic-like serine/threonine-protein kinase
MIGKMLGPYEILSLIGTGGMGEVWKARDTRLGRIVAIKKVKEQHSERFKQEARTIAALNHPYICQLHDIGPDYLVLEYVEGKPLSSPLPEKEAVRLAIQIATALEEAHGKGIIHRDLKPSNIMVTDKGSVKLLDFGLAKLYEQDAESSQSPTGEFPATQAGAVLGTVAYMSPEQAQGQPADARSDIFSFGLVLYEMLSGRRAFAGESNYAVMDAIVKRDPPPLQTSPSVEKVARRCLAKQPSGRYQTISEVKTALEQAFAEKASQTSIELQPSIAVLPFVNMSGDKEQEYFSDGLAEEIINALTQIAGLKVIARTSAFAFRGKEQDITKIAEALRVRTILEGSVRKSGNRIRITAQLIDASDGSHLWSERYDREMTDVFAIQDEICEAVVSKLRIKLALGGPLVKRHTENVEAYNLYLKGHFYLLKSDLGSSPTAKKYLALAIGEDANLALAWAGLANYYHQLGFLGGMQPKAANAQCRQAALKALELDEKLSYAHGMMGALLAIVFDWKGAEREFVRALELDPEAVDVRFHYDFFYLVPMRRLDEAIDVSRRTMELDPLSPFWHYQLGLRYYYVRRWDRTIEQGHNVIELDPQSYLAHQLIGAAYIQTREFTRAIQSFETMAHIAGRQNPLVLAYLGYAYARAGLIREAQRLLDELQEHAQKAFVPAGWFAWIYLGLGEIDKCFDWLNKAVDEGDGFILHLHVDPVFDPVRSHPRYHALLRKMNLEP